MWWDCGHTQKTFGFKMALLSLSNICMMLHHLMQWLLAVVAFADISLSLQARCQPPLNYKNLTWSQNLYCHSYYAWEQECIKRFWQLLNILNPHRKLNNHSLSLNQERREMNKHQTSPSTELIRSLGVLFRVQASIRSNDFKLEHNVSLIEL